MLVALGDSISSGHHRSSNLAIATCNDPAYGYPEYVWMAMEAKLPVQWRGSGYYNFARSGFSSSNVRYGGAKAFDACRAPYGSSSPLHDAEVILKAHKSSWTSVVITAGIDDTNWGAVLQSIAVHSNGGTAPAYTGCANDVSGWDGRTMNSATASNIRAIADGLRSPVTGNPAVSLNWLSYYNIAPSTAGHPPVPVSCGAPFAQAVATLDSNIRVALSTRMYNWVDTGPVMNQQTSKMQAWLSTDLAGMLLKSTSPGWPHPNTLGAKAIASIVP